jgi:hypothetical protein
LYTPEKTSGGSGKAFLQSKNLWSEGEQRKKDCYRANIFGALKSMRFPFLIC